MPRRGVRTPTPPEAGTVLGVLSGVVCLVGSTWAAQSGWPVWIWAPAAGLVVGLVTWWGAQCSWRRLREVAHEAEALVADEGFELTRPQVCLEEPPELRVLSRSLATLVSRLRERERELVALAGSLEERVQERTRALEQANSDLQSFTRTVSHDLKGPLNSIGAAVRYVYDEHGHALEPRPRQMLALISTECERLTALVDELLALSRVEQQPLELQPVDCGALVRAVLADHLGVPGTRDRAPRVVVRPLPAVQGDAVLLRQVWQNLIGNAVKFTRRTPQPLIEIEGQVRGEEVVFQVRDNGAGFDMRHVDRLFGVFQRLHSQADFPGSGIGLSIVKRVVQRHGGRVWASGRPGEGACFCFSLPYQAKTAVRQLPPASANAGTRAATATTATTTG